MTDESFKESKSQHWSGSGCWNASGTGRSHACVPKRVNLAKHFSHTHTDAKPDVTTVMIRNVPNQYFREQFMQELDKLGFEGKYDFVYLPIDRQTQWNVGYAFVNFEEAASATWCMEVMCGHKFTRIHPGQQQRLAQVSVAHLQGLEENLAHYENTAVFSCHSGGQLCPWVKPGALEKRRQVAVHQMWESPEQLGNNTDGEFQGYAFAECWQPYSACQDEEYFQQANSLSFEGWDAACAESWGDQPPAMHFLQQQAEAGEAMAMPVMQWPTEAAFSGLAAPMGYTVICIPAEMVHCVQAVQDAAPVCSPPVSEAAPQDVDLECQQETDFVATPDATPFHGLTKSRSAPDMWTFATCDSNEDACEVRSSTNSTTPSTSAGEDSLASVPQFRRYEDSLQASSSPSFSSRSEAGSEGSREGSLENDWPLLPGARPVSRHQSFSEEDSILDPLPARRLLAKA
eukprot:TRINITY_DN21250_c0_g1_i1.p1 TRINITY_DN21250_c0_g1~~TRINITY_DN21250_c0_g1_i1.p1  ORF type:complete len:491 (+),score=97.60 TRINITY_DN21250_c0_g1_i1:102-1475(+)